jgi:hypothetical protein
MATVIARGKTVPQVGPELTLPDVNQVDINLIHELSRGATGSVLEQITVIEPSEVPTHVRIRFEVVGVTNRILGSPVYMASIRRRKTRNLALAVAELEEHAEQDDFTTYTFAIIDQLKTLLAELADATKEGNSREILRQLRNTFLNKHWEQYRKPEARHAAMAILHRLADAEEVLPQDVKETFRKLTSSNLNAVGPALPAFDEEEEEQDGEEKEEVSG